MNIWEFFNEHWFLAWCALWLCWPVLFLFGAVFFKLPNRILRTINVCFRGWPPSHLDADGDFKPETEEEKSPIKGQ